MFTPPPMTGQGRKLGLCCAPSVMSKSLWAHGLQPARLLCPWRFSRQECWSGLPSPPPEDLPNPRDGTQVSCTMGRFSTTVPLGKPNRPIFVLSSRVGGGKAAGWLVLNSQAVGPDSFLFPGRHFLFKTSSGSTPLFSSSSPGYPLTSGTVYTPPPRLLPRNTFSRKAFKLKKPSKYCSWKCAALSAIAAALLLAILLAYFIGESGQPWPGGARSPTCEQRGPLWSVPSACWLLQGVKMSDGWECFFSSWNPFHFDEFLLPDAKWHLSEVKLSILTVYFLGDKLKIVIAVNPSHIAQVAFWSPASWIFNPGLGSAIHATLVKLQPAKNWIEE